MSAEHAAAKCIHEAYFTLYMYRTCTTDAIHTHIHTYTHVHYQLGVYIQGGINLFLPHHSPVPLSINSVKFRLNYNLEGFIQQK